MLLTRQQAKAQKRNAKRLGQLLKEVRTELEQSLAALEDTAIENGSWGMTEMSYSQDAYSLIGQILAIADKWEQCNHFEIDEQLAQIEKKVYID
jgi:L-rhamnose isomerase